MESNDSPEISDSGGRHQTSLASLRGTREEKSKIVSESDGNTAMLTVKMWAFLSGFSCPTQTLLLLAPVLLRPGEATHSEFLGTKRVKVNLCMNYDLPAN